MCVQPRRIAVVAAAKRVAELMGVELGASVGYRIGNDNKSTNQTALLFVTAGMLLEMFAHMGCRNALKGFSCIVLDEVHESSAENDFVLTILAGLVKEGLQNKVT